MKPTAEQQLDTAIFSKRHNNQLPDIRRFRLAMMAEKKVGFWARALRGLRGVK